MPVDAVVTVRVLRGHCRECRWWQSKLSIDSLDGPRDEGAWGVCAMTRTPYRAFSYQNGVGWGWAHPDTKAIASGEDDSYHRLWTAPDFGCVQFERKPEEGPRD